jgi:putative heme-binding domain-containing protein
VALLREKDEHLRVWAIRLLTDRWPMDSITGPMPGAVHVIDDALIPEFEALARNDASGLVRLTLASTLQRMPVSNRAAIAAALVTRKEDAEDAQLPPMVWYGLIPVADANPISLVEVARVCEWPSTLKWITRNLASRMETNAAPLNALLSQAWPGQRATILEGIADATHGWRKAPKPEAWDRFAASLASQGHDEMLRELNVVFGDGRALDAVKAIALDAKADMPARQSALKAVIESRPSDLRAICESLLDVRVLNGTAARGLALFDDPEIGAKLADSYRKFAPAQRPAVMETLVSRVAFAKPLLDQIAAGKIARTDLTAFHARQIRSLNDAALTQRLAEAWGELRDSSADKQQVIADLKGRLTTATLAKADLGAGRAVFQTVCGACHAMYGSGGKIGPDLTGSGRANLDYLLENIVDPSAVVSADYRMSIITLKDGRVLLGIITAQTDRTLTLRLLTEETTLEKKDIAKREASPVSMMPEGQLLALSPDQVRDLVAYLMHPVQVPLPPAPK